MHTLKALKEGSLFGIKKLTLAEELTEFPKEIYNLAETLEVLDMTNNNLSSLPSDFTKLKNLKILFLSNNQFQEFPAVLANCSKLSMIGFRNNQIHYLPENALPLGTRWLILTDNNLTKLPDSIGNLFYLQKMMLSGNELRSLPTSLSKCQNLELLRIAVNRLKEFPICLLALPKLSWLAYSGNPFCTKHPRTKNKLDEVQWDKLVIEKLLGEGASGHIYAAMYNNKKVAVKIFKGAITSDGLPEEEMNINIAMGSHVHLIDALALVIDHPEGKNVLMLELIPEEYVNLGFPPTLATCSRDVYAKDLSFSLNQVISILQGMVKAAFHMHRGGIMHGDFYAHNIMINKDAHAILGDFGGASYFEPKEKIISNALERLEVRAYGCLIEELLNLCTYDTGDNLEREKLLKLQIRCMHSNISERPLFEEILVEMLYLE
ncbi:MAG: serine/threonine protein kinase [uncultured Sulfurovum sp.]|uniref:Serine/threonine protein kinase n=1 Tax=uncultured Sulfurovum sp. TaxID=269237 RepID=A0A6S6T4Z7_9BACT|nr:MAG: serine/threonine protein kinase [uncultured Sulfurovum sp.]